MSSSAETTPKRTMPLLPKLLLALAALLVVLILLIAVWRMGMASGNAARFKAIKAAGEPASARELDDWYEAVDDKENAALIWLDGIAKFNPKLEKDQASPWSRIKMPSRDQRLTQTQFQMASDIVQANKEALELFRRAATMPRSRYPVDFSQGMFAELAHLSPLKSAASVLQVEALVHAQSGRGGKAAESIQALLGAGRSLAQEPILISQLVRAAMDSMAVSSAERTLNLTALTEPQLAALQAAFAAAETPNLTTRALIGERACTATMLNSPRDLKPPSNPDELQTSLMTQKGFGSSLMRASGLLQRDLGFFLDAMATNIAISRSADPGPFLGGTNLQAIELRARREYYVMTSMLLPALTRTTVRDVEHRARLRAAQTALAVERFRLANAGRLPASLAELTPKYLAALPVDPFDGEPLRFKTRTTGYVVYSIGQDGKDDGGTPLPSGKQADKTPHDIPFVVEK
jgi:hypothetical protein